MNTPNSEPLIEQLLANIRQDDIPASKAVQYVDQVLSTFRRISLIGQDDTYVIRVLESIGESYEALGSLIKATEILQEALDLVSRLQDRASEGTLRWKLGRVYRKRNLWDEAITQVQESRKIHETLENQTGQAQCWNSEGLIYFSQGNYANAEEAYHFAIQQSEAIGDQRIASGASMNLGILANIRGDFGRALLLYQNSLTVYEQSDSREAMARAYHNIGICYSAQSNWPAALDAFEKSLDIALTAGHLILSAVNYIEKASVFLELNDTSVAATYCAQAIDICKEVDYPLGVAEAYRVLGKMYTAKGDYSTAHSLLTESLNLCDQYNDPLAHAETRRQIGILHISTNETEQARNTLETARQEFETLGAQHDAQITQNLIDTV